MPNEINPFDYNIDSFDSGFLGPITDSNFRTFLFTHNLQSVNPVIQNTLGGNLFVDRGSEYDVSQSTFNVRDVPNLQTVANTPSVHNNLTNPRQTNVGRNLTTINPEVATEIGSNSLTSEGLGNDAATLINNNPTVVDVPNLQNVASNPSVYNDLTNPRQDNLSKKVQNIDASIQNNLGVTTPTNAGQGNDVTTLFNPNTSNVDVPNLRTVANTPSVYNNLTNPREVNLSKKLQNLDPEIQNILGQNTALQAGLGVDAPDNFNANVSNVNLPGVSVVANTPSNLNNQTNPTEVNLVKNPTKAELSAWYPNYSYWINSENDTYKQPFNVPNTLKLGFVGDVEKWVYPNGMVTSTSIIRDLRYYKQNNKYGPSTLTAYEASDFAPPPQTEKSVLQKAYDVTIGPLIDAIKSGSFSQEVGPVTPNQRIINQETGLIGYSTEVKSDFKDQLLNRTLGVGIVPFGLTEGIPVLGSTSIIGSGINFKPDGKDISNLDRIARKRRLIEIFNRVKSNAIDDTIGRFGFLERPFATVADTKNIFEKNYIITSRKGAVGSILQSASSLIGLNPVNSPIPSGAFTPSNDVNSFSKQVITTNGYDISEDLLDTTGNATRSLLFEALKINKYGPRTQEKYRLQYKSEEQENYLTFNPREKNLKEKLDSLQKQGKVSPPGEFIQVTEGGPSNPADQDNSTPIYGGFFGKFETPINDNSFSDKIGFNETDSAKPYTQILDSTIRPSNTSYRGTPTELNVTDRITDEKYQWIKQDEGKTPNPFAKGLIRYTKALANKATREQGAGYIAYFDSEEAFNGNPDYKQSINRHGHSTGIKNISNSPILPSKGNTSKTAKINTNNGEIETNSGEYYCRSWSSRRKYHNYENLIRNDVNWRYGKKNDKTMTMNWDANNGRPSNGMPKIAWTQNDSDNYGESYKKQIIGALKDTQILKGQMIPYMFSIENLAWVGSPHVLELAPCEIGPNGGRIMWFPPYNLEISDSSSVSWDPTSFIGRGENIYTYNNTERTGTLDFTLIVDHPSVLNDLKNNFKENIYKGGDEIYHSFFAGCDAETIKKYFDGYIPTILKDVVEEFEIPPPELNITPPEQPPINDVKVFFENARNSKKENVGIKIDLENYEIKFPFTADWSGNDKGEQTGQYGEQYVDTKLWETNDLVYPCGPAGTNSYKYLNTDVKKNLEKLAFFLAGTESGKNYKIKFFGSASAAPPGSQQQQTSKNVNEQIAENRGKNFKDYFKEILLGVENYLLTYYPDKVPVRLSVDNELTYPLEKDLLENEDRWENKVGFEPQDYANQAIQAKTFVESITGIDVPQSNQDITNTLKKGDGQLGANPCCPNCILPKPWDVDETTGEIPFGNKNSNLSKISRYAKLSLEVNSKLQENLLIEANNKLKPKKETRIVGQEEVKNEIIAQEIAKRFVTECDAFEHIKYKLNPFIYESLREKIRYFHPAFHSQTPEGFNGRLTFLKQCTRQGPQIIDKNSPANMVFGRPPVLVLRIGDFYHTKIIPDNVNITYEPLQWDLNPEGIGVQPMLAKVSISFKYIGGSSLGGPIRQLQNAVSFNFFANTSVYNPAQIKTQQLLEKKYNFIYGAFASPEEERKLTRELESLNNVSEEIKKEEQNVVTVQDTQPAQTTTEEKQKVEEEATKNNTGEVKPPAPPVKGNKLKDVLRDINKAGYISTKGNYIIKKSGSVEWITNSKEPSTNGIYLYEKLLKDTGLKKFINRYYIKFNDKGDFVINKETFIRENNGTERVASGSYKGLLFGKYYNFGSPTNEYGEATLQFTDGKIIKGNAWYPDITLIMVEVDALIKTLKE